MWLDKRLHTTNTHTWVQCIHIYIWQRWIYSGKHGYRIESANMSMPQVECVTAPITISKQQTDTGVSVWDSQTTSYSSPRRSNHKTQVLTQVINIRSVSCYRWSATRSDHTTKGYSHSNSPVTWPVWQWDMGQETSRYTIRARLRSSTVPAGRRNNFL